VFGYLTFSNDPDSIVSVGDILEMPAYLGNTAIQVATIGVLFTVFAGAPLCVLPAKDVLEELIFPSGITKL
jgi:hypothetical protein